MLSVRIIENHSVKSTTVPVESFPGSTPGCQEREDKLLEERCQVPVGVETRPI